MRKILSLLTISFLLLVNINISFGAESCNTEEIPNSINVHYLPYNSSYSYILLKSNGKQVFVYNGIEGQEYNKIKEVKYSLDGSHYAYIVENKYGGNTLVIDGKQLEKWYYGVSKIKNFVFSTDGNHYAFVTINKDNNKSYLIKDGFSGKGYDYISNIMYSQQDKDFRYVAAKGNQKSVFIQKGIESKEYKILSKVKYSPDGNEYAFIIKKDNLKEVVIQNGIEGKEYDSISELSYDLIDKKFFYRAYNYENKFMLIKGDIEKKHDYFYNMLFSPNNTGYSYISFGGGSVVRNGIKGKEYPKILPNSLLYSPDGKSLSYVAQTLTSGKVIIKDGTESDFFINVQKVLYSPDSKDFYYIAGNDKLYLFKNGLNISKENTSIHDIRFSKDSTRFYYEYVDSKGNYITSIRTCNSEKVTTTNNNNNNNLKNINNVDNSYFLDKKYRYKFIKKRILSKKELNKTFKGRRDISTIDLIVRKLSKQNLELLILKLKNIDTSSFKFKKYKATLDYLESKIRLELFISSKGQKDKIKTPEIIEIPKIKIDKPKKTTNEIKKVLVNDNIIYHGYGNNSFQEVKNKKLGDKVSIGTFYIYGDNQKQEAINLKLKYRENGININNFYLYDGLGNFIYGKNNGNIGEIEFPNVLVGITYGLYGTIGSKLNINGNFTVELLGIDKKNFKIEEKNIGTIKFLGINENIKPELTINTYGIDYFYPGNNSTTFSLNFGNYNNSYMGNIYLDKITLNISNLLRDGNVILKNLNTLEEKNINGVPKDGKIVFDMGGILIKDKSTFKIITSARGTFTIPKNGVIYHTEDNSTYGNNNFYQMGGANN